MVEDAIEKWYSIKLWSKENNKNPKLFGQKEEEKIGEKTFKEVAEEWFNDVNKNKVKREHITIEKIIRQMTVYWR